MNKKEKFQALVKELSDYINIKREALSEMVIRVYGINSIHAVNGKINLLLAHGVISKNSHYFPDLKKACPHTVYSVNKESISEVLSKT